MTTTVRAMMVVLLACWAPAASHAQVPDANSGQLIPNARACAAIHAGNGQLVAVRQRVGPSPYWAHSQWDLDGWPAITYGAAYFQIPPLMQVFTTTHECGHLVLQTVNEFAANCFALRTLPLSSADKLAIAAFHKAIGLLPPQYGGSGAAFWEMTRQSCPQFADP